MAAHESRHPGAGEPQRSPPAANPSAAPDYGRPAAGEAGQDPQAAFRGWMPGRSDEAARGGADAGRAANLFPQVDRPATSQRATSSATRWRMPPEEEDEETEASLSGFDMVRGAPPWLVSMVVHVTLLLVLGLMILPERQPESLVLEGEYSSDLSAQLEEHVVFRADDPLSLEEPDFASEEMASQAGSPGRGAGGGDRRLPRFHHPLRPGNSGDRRGPDGPCPGHAAGPGGRLRWYGGHGGSGRAGTPVALAESAERTVPGACGVLTPRVPLPKTSWRLRPWPCWPFRERATRTSRAPTTSKWQTPGNTCWAGRTRTAISGAEAMAQQRLYSQAQATIALCELYGMTKDSTLREPAQRAIDYAIRIQAPEGGWRYDPGLDTDTSVTGWFVMALQSGLMAGLEIPAENLTEIGKYLDGVSRGKGSFYVYYTRPRRFAPHDRRGLTLPPVPGLGA